MTIGTVGVRAQEPRPETKAGGETKADLDAILSQMRAAGGPGRVGGGASDRHYPDFNEMTRGAEKIDGLFTLHRKDEHLYAEIRPHQLDQPMLVLATIARGLGRTGEPVSNGDEMVVVFRKVDEHIQLVRRNISYKATPGTPIEKSVKQNYVDSVLMSLPIRTVSPSGATVIDLADMFMTDLAQLNLGFLDRSRSSWYKVKGLKDNLELEVEATFGGAGMRGMMAMFGGNDGVADPRGITLVIHYSLIRLPNDFGFRTRLADDRIGHWLSTSKDFGSTDSDSNYVRLLNRWRLDKADMRAKLSPPRKQVVWWVEDTVPHEYRPYVEAGILEWNKAFEKIGFRNALAVRWQQPGEEFDPEDTSYCTFRWVTSDRGYARTCFRSNPLTGEIIDGDVIFDSSFIRHWKQEYALMIGAKPTGQGGELDLTPLAVGEVISPIMAAKYGFGGPLPLTAGRGNGAANAPSVVPADWSSLDYRLSRLARRDGHTCTYQAGMQADFALAAMALAVPDRGGKGGPVEVPEEFIGQALKEVVMHEVGHSIGLRHNFKASAMLTAEQLNDTAITRVKGLVGSVMDYSPVNIAPKGVKQGDYYTTTLGPYDYWAIEYAYKPIMGDEAGELRAIAARAPEPDLAFATDEDAALNNDPQVNRFDLGSDVCRFAKDRIALSAELLKDLDAKVVRDGEPWSRNRRAFAILLSQYGNAAYLVSNYIGGQSISRDHKGDKNARDPIVPVPGPKQRECLAFLVDQILSDRAFKFSPALLRRLATEKWSGWGNEAMMLGEVDYPVHQRVLDVQRIVLAQCLAPEVLARLQNQELQAEPGSKPLKMAEVFRTLSDGIWSEANPDADCDCCDLVDDKAAKPDDKAKAAPREVALSTVRRNLQREYLKRLSTIVLGERRGDFGGSFAFLSFNGGGSYPADARALARLHLRQIGDRIGKLLERKDVTIDDTTRAHLEDCRHKIGKVLEAGLDANEP
jgi:hypothetical protein